MSEFKIKCQYIGVEKKKFFRDQEPVEYHRFSMENPQELPRQFFHSSTRLGKGDFNSENFIVYCVIFISANLVKKANLDFKYNQ
jgi:hypothetical protein